MKRGLQRQEATMNRIQAAFVTAAAGVCTLASMALGANPIDLSTAREARPSGGDRPKLGACIQSPKYNDAGKRAMFVIEAETLLGAGKAQANAGTLAVQPMAGFGPGWGGNAQLFWSGGSPGAVLDITYFAPIGGRYQIYLGLTKAPDYGWVSTQYTGGGSYLSGGEEAFVNGSHYDNWASAVEPPYFHAGPPPNYGYPVSSIARLRVGENKLALKITGKHDKSTGYLIGIDCIILHRYPEHMQKQ
jgi:hypothetical protein